MGLGRDLKAENKANEGMRGASWQEEADQRKRRKERKEQDVKGEEEKEEKKTLARSGLVLKAPTFLPHIQ